MAFKPRLASRPPAVTGWSSILGCPMRAFWPRAARTWAVTRRPAEQSSCASLWQLFKACNDTAVLQFLLARGRAAQFFPLYRLAAAQSHSPRPHSSSCASQQQRTAVFSSALLFGPKPVLTAPVISAETATNQRRSPRSMPRQRPQPLRGVCTRVGPPRGEQNRPSLRAARDESSRRTHGSQWQPRRRGSTKYLLAKAPNFWTGQG